MPANPRSLILWDIDGTLLHARGVGKNSMVAAIKDVFGVTVDWSRIDHVGRTDAYICRCIAKNHGLNFGVAMQRFSDRYTQLLKENLKTVNPEPLPGVRALLEKIHKRSDIVQGLLTGNLREAAFIKLACFGLKDFFDFGAFGDEHEDRCALASVALQRARAVYGGDMRNVVVIGDTHHDAACGRALGARVVLVATGVRSLQDLALSKPDLLLQSLAEIDGNIDILLGSKP